MDFVPSKLYSKSLDSRVWSVAEYLQSLLLFRKVEKVDGMFQPDWENLVYWRPTFYFPSLSSSSRISPSPFPFTLFLPLSLFSFRLSVVLLSLSRFSVSRSLLFLKFSFILFFTIHFFELLSQKRPSQQNRYCTARCLDCPGTAINALSSQALETDILLVFLCSVMSCSVLKALFSQAHEQTPYSIFFNKALSKMRFLTYLTSLPNK